MVVTIAGPLDKVFLASPFLASPARAFINDGVDEPFLDTIGSDNGRRVGKCTAREERIVVFDIRFEFGGVELGKA